MSTVFDTQNLNLSVEPRRRSASIAVPVTLYTTPEVEESEQIKPNVHVSVSVSLNESLASISAWAAQIVPGSPPVPSPRRSSFYSLSPKTPAFPPRTPRRSSVSTTFINLRDSPSSQPPYTPAPKSVSPSDLLAHGYTSIFVHLPTLRRGSDCASPPDSPSPTHKTANAPLPVPRVQPRPRTKSLAAEKKTEKPSSLTRLRSLSFKGKKSKPSSEHAAPAVEENIPPMPALPSSSSHSRSAQSKKPKSTPQSRYGAILAPGGGAGALPLAQEIALAQMLDGGSRDVNMRRVTERHARATGAQSKSTSARDEAYKGDRKDRRPIERREREEKIGGGVSGVYRDQNGGLWWDEDESYELAGLLPSSDAQPHAQMPLGSSSVHNQEREKRRGLLPRLMTSAKPPPTTSLPAPPSWVALHSPSSPHAHTTPNGRAGLRKGSASDASSPDTDGEDLDLDPAYAVRPREATALFAAGYTMGPVAGAEKERHLRRTPRGIEAFGVSPLDIASGASEAPASTATRERRERKRPAPLTLPLPLPTPHAPSCATASTTKSGSRPPKSRVAPPPLPTMSVNGPTREESEGRQEFFASAFAPAPPASTTSYQQQQQQQQPEPHMQMKPKVARRGSMSLGLSSFGLGSSGKAGRRSSLASASPTSPAHMHTSPYVNGSVRGGSSAHLALGKTTSRPSTANGTGAGAGAERSLKSKASRSRLAGLFKRG